MIQHRTARRIASDWHGGGRSPLYALASTGAIVDGCAAEVSDLLAPRGTAEYLKYFGPVRADLDKLAAYIAHYGPRPPVPDWDRRYRYR